MPASGLISRRNPSPRLLFLSTNMRMGGGAEEQVIQLAYGFKSRGWDVMIVSMLPPSPMPPGFETSGIPLLHLGMRRGIPSSSSMYQLAKIIRDFRPDVVHSHMVHANLLARAVRPFQPFPVLICTMHNLTMAGEKRDLSPIFELAHRFTDILCDKTTAICQAASDHCVKKRAVPAKKMLTLHNGIELEKFFPSSEARERTRRELGVEEKFVWLAVGRLELAKAYPTMLRAMAQRGDGKRVLLVCGNGSLAGELQALSEELGIAGQVRFLGLRSDIPALMSAADGFAMSSDLEGLPLVLLQAAAAALPIIATDVGGNAEVVVDRLNGRLVPPGDPAHFSRAMAELEGMNVEQRKSLGRAGQERVRGMFDLQLVLTRWERLYEELFAAAKRSHKKGGTFRTGPRSN